MFDFYQIDIVRFEDDETLQTHVDSDRTVSLKLRRDIFTFS